MTSTGAVLRRTFAAFRVHNFRLYFAGQVVSVSGAWMQRVAQSWLVLDLPHSSLGSVLSPHAVISKGKSDTCEDSS